MRDSKTFACILVQDTADGVLKLINKCQLMRGSQTFACILVQDTADGVLKLI